MKSTNPKNNVRRFPFMSRIALRNFLITVLTTLICIAVFTVLLLGQFYAYAVEEQLKTLTNACSNLSYTALTWITEPYRLDTTALQNMLSAQAKVSRTNTMIVDEEGNVLIFVNAKDSLTDCGCLSASVMARINSGETIQEYGTLEGWYADSVISVAVPVYDSAQNIRAAVVVSANPGSIGAVFAGMAKTVVLITVFVVMFGFAMTYFVSQRLASPINNMAFAADRIAHGDFTVRVSEEGNDEIANLARSFNIMAKSMEELENVRSDFVANVSHELKTPMTTISGFVDGMLDGTIPPENTAHYLAVVSEESHRLSRIVTRLLLATRMQSGTGDMNIEPLDICSCISSVLVNLEQKIEERNLSVEVNYADDRVFVMGDNDALTQVVGNLIDNAVKYNRDGGHLAVTVEKRPEKVFVTVFNTGEGIKQEDLPHIFDRFYKADRSRGLDKKSTGLGLYLVRSILKNLHQQITAESEPGEWTRFTFTLEPARLGTGAEHGAGGQYVRH